MDGERKLSFEIRDVRDLEVDYRLKVIFQQYPVMRTFYNAARMIEPTEGDFEEAALMVRDAGMGEEFEQLRQRDPDFPQKYKFLWAAGFMDNPNIPPEEKQKMLSIIYPPEDKSTEGK